MDLITSFGAAVQRIGADPAIRVVLLRGKGPDFRHGGDFTSWLWVRAALRAPIARSIGLAIPA